MVYTYIYTSISNSGVSCKSCENLPQKYDKKNYSKKNKKTILALISHCVKSVQISRIFWFLFSRIRTEYGDFLRKSPYSVRMRENKDEKNSVLDSFHAVWKLESDSRLPPKMFYLLQWKLVKYDENYFLFHLKSFFRSWYI